MEIRKACVVGVGAIGGLIGYGLSRAGCEVAGIARGRTLEALRSHGLRFEGAAGMESVPIHAWEDPRDAGVQDLVVLAVKAPALPALATRLKPLLGPDTIVLPAMNGIPWWFFEGFGGKLSGVALDSVDPGRTIGAAIPADAVIGCVVHLGASCPEPGLVRSIPLRRLIIGEPSGLRTERLTSLEALLTKAGFEVHVSGSIQNDVWYKLWGNMTMNPLSALTGATMDKILGDPLVERFCLDIMREAKRVGERIGCHIDQTCEERIGISKKLGAFKTSMLQDVEAGRPLELDALLGCVAEIGALLREPTPNIELLLGLARLKAKVLGLYPRG